MTDEAPTPLPRGGPNALAVALGLLGDEWTLLILRYALQGARRYQEWRDRLPISDAVLSSRLARLTEAGLLARSVYRERPVRHEYRLTRRGRAVWPVLVSIWGWELRWATGHREALPWMRHRGCGARMEPVLVCGACAAPVLPRDIRAAPGPSGGAGRSIPAGATRRRSGSGDGGGAGLFPETLALIGNRWSVGLLGAAFLGDRRFGQFQERLGAPPAMVANRLKTFLALGVLAAHDGGYRLTRKGRAFFPVLMALVDWGQRWYAAPEGAALLCTHRACGCAFTPRLVCGRCGERLTGQDVRVEAV